jgi:hypothetical protein
MKPALILSAAALILVFTGSCLAPKEGGGDTLSGWPMVSERFKDKPFSNLAILPVSAVDTVKPEERDMVRKSLYALFLKKDYAPLSPGFTDKTLADLGLSQIPICTQYAWNTSPFKGCFSDYCDALAFVSIERRQASREPGSGKVEVWGKLAIHDSLSMELLYEHYVQCALPTAASRPGMIGGVPEPLEAMAGLLLDPLPGKAGTSP